MKIKFGCIQPMLLAIGVFVIGLVANARTFVHPGLSYTQGDLDRMRTMVEAKEEPFYSTFLLLKSSKFCATNLTEYSRGGAILSESSFEGMIRVYSDTARLWA